MITYKGHYSLSKEPWEMSFEKTTPMGFHIDIEGDEHELYFVMPGELLEPWMVPLIPTDNDDKKYLRFLRQTGLDNFWWVPVGRSVKIDNACMTADEAAMRFIK